MGTSRYGRFVVKNKDIPLGHQEEWDRIVQVLQLSDTQRLLIADKSSQPLCSAKPEVRSKGKSGKNTGESSYNTSVKDGLTLVVLFVGKTTTKAMRPPIRESTGSVIFPGKNV